MRVKFFETFFEISRLQSELNKVFRNLIEAQKEEANRLAGEIVPEVDIFETARYLTLKIDLPGVQAKDIRLSLSGNILLISGRKRQMEIHSNKVKFHCLERSYGSFYRLLRLDVPVERSNIKAWLENGLLTIRFSKIFESEQKEILIEIKKR